MEATPIRISRLSRRLISAVFYLGTACLLLTAVARLQFGSIENSVAYLRGERIRVDEATRKLGQVRVGDTRVVRFSLTNLTGRAIKVLGSRVSCGCTEVRDVPESLSRSEAQSVELVFRPVGDQAGSNVEGMLTLFLDDPVVNQLSLTFNAYVTSDQSDPTLDRTHSG